MRVRTVVRTPEHRAAPTQLGVAVPAAGVAAPGGMGPRTRSGSPWSGPCRSSTCLRVSSEEQATRMVPARRRASMVRRAWPASPQAPPRSSSWPIGATTLFEGWTQARGSSRRWRVPSWARALSTGRAPPRASISRVISRATARGTSSSPIGIGRFARWSSPRVRSPRSPAPPATSEHQWNRRVCRLQFAGRFGGRRRWTPLRRRLRLDPGGGRRDGAGHDVRSIIAWCLDRLGGRSGPGRWLQYAGRACPRRRRQFVRGRLQ